MYYYKVRNNVIEKFEVKFDIIKVEELRKRIINDCSEIEHKEYKSDYDPTFNFELIRNFKREDTKEKKEYDVEVRRIYKYSFDLLKPPYLVELMDGLLENHSYVIEKIIKYKPSKNLSINDQIKIVSKELDKIDNENVKEKKEKLEELEKLLKSKKININQKDEMSYYKEFLELLKIELVDAISIEELDRLSSFLDTEFMIEKGIITEKKLKKVK